MNTTVTPLTWEQRQRFARRLDMLAAQIRDERIEIRVADMSVAIEMDSASPRPFVDLDEVFYTNEVSAATAQITVEMAPHRSAAR